MFFFETLVSTYEYARRRTPEEQRRYNSRFENLKSKTMICSCLSLNPGSNGKDIWHVTPFLLLPP
jgi:hypothetical protein